MRVRVLAVVLFALFLPQLAAAQDRELAQASPCDPDKLETLKIEAQLNGERVYNLATFGDAPFWDPRKYALKDGENFAKLMLDARTQEAFRANGMTETELGEVRSALEAGQFEDVMLQCGDPFTFMVSQDYRGMTTITRGRMGFNVRAIFVTLADGRRVGLIRWCGNPILIPAPKRVLDLRIPQPAEIEPLVDFNFRRYVPPVLDVCENIPGDQATIPLGMKRDEHGNCEKPVVVKTKGKPNWVVRGVVGLGLGYLTYKGIDSIWGNTTPQDPLKTEGPGGRIIK